MNEREYDFVVLGGGSAGYAAARTAAAGGLRVAVVEGAERMGGLCILRGCMPSKALLASAGAARTIRRADEFGLRSGQLEVKTDEVIRRKNRLIAEFADYRQQQLSDGRFELIRGHGRFRDSHSLEVELLAGGSRSIAFRSALLATGSEISRLPLPGLEQAGYLVSDDVLDLESLPQSVAVLGGGAIALEMAHYLAALGVEVSVIQRSEHVLSDGDRDVGEALADAMRAQGVNVITGTRLLGAGRVAGRKFIDFEHAGTPRRIECAQILQALGRHPATAGLGLESAGIALDGRAIPTSPTQQVAGCPHIFAAGDVCGPYEIVHIAIQQGEIAARNAARLLASSEAPLEMIDYRLRLYAIFTEPEVAVAGLTEREARALAIDTAVASYPFDDHGKSLVMGETHGFVKLLADRATGQLIGGAVVGPHGSDLIHEIVVALAVRMTPAQLAAIPHYHPTLSEIWTYPAEDLADDLGGCIGLAE